MNQSLDERFWSKVDPSGDCWLWMACLDKKGYGRFGLGGREAGVGFAHRVAYELIVGPIPEGQYLDHRHTCPKNCVNPQHLRPTTHKQNHENRAGTQRNNKSSGVRGVTWNKKNQAWQGQVKHHQQNHYVGLFPSIEEAESAVIAKRNELFTHNDADRKAG